VVGGNGIMNIMLVSAPKHPQIGIRIAVVAQLGHQL